MTFSKCHTTITKIQSQNISIPNIVCAHLHFSFLPPALGIHVLLSVSIYSPHLDISYKCNQKINGLLCMASSLRMFLRFFHVVASVFPFYCSTVFHCSTCTTLYLSIHQSMALGFIPVFCY